MSNYIDWESIPIHIRCTGREKIDPRYPGSARWWAQQERQASAAEPTPERSPHVDNPGKSKYLPDFISAMEGRETSVSELARIWGIETKAVPSIVGSLSFTVPVYEGREGNEKRFGILGATA